MASNPMSSFLNAFVAAQGIVGTSANDRLAEYEIAQNQIRYQDGADQRAADLAATQANTAAVQLSNQAQREALANQSFAEFEMAAGDMGVVAAMNDPVASQRLIRAANLKARPGAPTLVGFDRMGRDNAANWGMDPGLYDSVLAGKNPNGVAEPDDEVIVPLYETADGPQPLDVDGDGQIEHWSAKQAYAFVRGQFVGSDEYAQVLGTLRTGTPGGSATLGGQPAAPVQPTAAPAQPAAPAEPPAFNVTEPNIRTAGGTGVAQMAEDQPRLAMTEQEMAQQRFTEAWGVPPTGGGPTIDVTQAAGEATQPVTALGDAGKKASKDIPVMPGESTETAIGVPKDRLSEVSLRSARRVAQGQGISPAQAKELAQNPEEVPMPSPRAVVAAGAQTLSGLEQTGQTFSVSGGKRPTHKQLTGAVMLMRAGLLEKDDLTRYADTGQLSTDGVQLIQQGMVSATSMANNAADNARALQQTGLQQAGQTQREYISQQGQTQRKLLGEYAAGNLDAQGNRIEPALTPQESIDNLTVQAKNQLLANGADAEVAATQGRVIAAKIQELKNDSAAMRGTGWGDAKYIDSVSELSRISRDYNEFLSPTGLGRQAARWVTGRPTSIDLASNPVAVMLHAEGANVFGTGEQGLLWDEDKAPDFITMIQDPMFNKAKELGALGMIKDNPDFQKRVYDIAALAIRAEAAEDPGVLNDSAFIQTAIQMALQKAVEAQRAVGQ